MKVYFYEENMNERRKELAERWSMRPMDASMDGQTADPMV
jgi:hypothetical protein